MEDDLSYIFNPKLRLQLDRKRWLDIIEMLYKDWQKTKNPD
jgi:hypothetical protein